ncbi:acetyltransferase [Sulfolobales archaeon HS-7]|nr:acetyltransferase [Sulfolobales archaeon HS-7]
MAIEEFMGKKPVISPSAFIHSSAYIMGDVNIGDDTSIWHYATIRGDNEKVIIGKGSNIQEHCSIHTDTGFPSILGNYVSVGHNAVIHGASISDYVIVGMGAILLNGSRVGEYSIIGAGSVVTEGTVIPPYSIAVGVPAKVIRKANEKDVKRITENAYDYIRLVKAMRKVE